jgi:outer membrane protein assembly factor BamE (lipoprotein component of BamABCDE complex)
MSQPNNGLGGEKPGRLAWQAGSHRSGFTTYKGKKMRKKSIFRKSLWFLITATAPFLLCGMSGCSVYMAAKQPTAKNLDIMTVGTPRSAVLAELGQPVATENKDGKKVDVFSFVQGYSKASKTGRAAFHGVADVFTLGLWEVVGTPTEAVFDGTKVSYEITYDKGSRIEKVVPLTDKSREAAAKQLTGPSAKPEHTDASSGKPPEDGTDRPDPPSATK